MFIEATTLCLVVSGREAANVRGRRRLEQRDSDSTPSSTPSDLIGTCLPFSDIGNEFAELAPSMGETRLQEGVDLG